MNSPSAPAIARAVISTYGRKLLPGQGPNLIACRGETPVYHWGGADLFEANNSPPKYPSARTVRRLMKQHGGDALVILFPTADEEPISMNVVVRQASGTTTFLCAWPDESDVWCSPTLTEIGWAPMTVFVARGSWGFKLWKVPFMKMIASRTYSDDRTH